MTEEEKEEFLQLAEDRILEKAILILPEVMNNLLKEKASMQQLGKEFYNANKEFNNHKDVVGVTIEEIETANPGKPYKDILTEATPIIAKRIKAISMSDMSGSRPGNLTYVDTVVSKPSEGQNGEI